MINCGKPCSKSPRWDISIEVSLDGVICVINAELQGKVEDTLKTEHHMIVTFSICGSHLRLPL
jgi:hypothetical protein